MLEATELTGKTFFEVFKYLRKILDLFCIHRQIHQFFFVASAVASFMKIKKMQFQ